MGKQWKQCQTLFWEGSKITADGDCSHEIKRRLLLGRKVMTNLDWSDLACVHTLEKEMATHSSILAWRIPGSEAPGGLPSMRMHRVRHDWSNLAAAADSILKSRDITLPTKVHLDKAMVFPVVTYGCESWTIKKAERWRIDAFELWCWRRLLTVPWMQGDPSVNPKGNQSWIFIGRTDAEAEAPIFWPPDAKNWLLGKDPDAGKDWKEVEKGKIEDEMVGWHHQLNGHEFK